MKIVYYRDSKNIKGSSGGIENFFKELSNDPQLLNMVYETYKQVKNSSNLDALERNGWVKRLSNSKEPIYEFRIPPRRKEGVARLYFGYKKNYLDTIVILSAEIKHGKNVSNRTKTKQAKQRYMEVCK